MPSVPNVLLLVGDAQIIAEPGDTVLSAMQNAGEKIQTVCKGRGICGACRVLVDDAFFNRLSPPSTSETRMLRFLRSREANQDEVNHRLACQIVLESRLSGLRITPDPIVPKAPTLRPPTQEIKS
ncbi:MAG: 2Fe-2S iron-sulfur cluster-binding protein [Acidiphilium sp.]|nr:2Fe-2S iron-sulfur cluster-binding protein [Acidiphilium sp.]MDD4936123.1 2Fe-2S iron-sulfur cluster-binding protein [Acidiphilium sp.]